MKTKLPALLVIFLLTANLQAQSKYVFSKTTASYADLSGDADVTHSIDTSLGFYLIPGLTGETFKFFDVAFPFGGLKTIAVGQYPFLRVDNDSSLVIVDAAFTYADSIDPTSKISYLLQGAAGNKILKTQYKNLMLRTGQAGNFINVQIWYFQQTGIIEIHYGPRSANNAGGYNISQGPNIGIFYSPDDFSGCYEKLWCNGSPASMTLDSATNYVFKAMSGVPDDATVYRFTPRMKPPSTLFLREEVERYEVTVSPNPASDKIRVSADHGLKGKVFIRNILGSTVSEFFVDDRKSIDISISGLNPGVYFIVFQSKEGILSEKKFLVE